MGENSSFTSTCFVKTVPVYDFKLVWVVLRLSVKELYFVIIRSPNYCSDSVPPGPRSRKRLFKARLQRKKPCICDYFLLSLFRSALQDKDVLLVHHRFALHMKVKKQVLTLRVRTGITALNKEELLILITVQKKRNSLMTIKLRLTLLLIRSFSKAMKINKKNKKLIMSLAIMISTRKFLG